MRDKARRVGPKPMAPVGCSVAVRFFADEEQRHGAVAPKAEVEGEPAEHADHGVDDFDRQAGELHDADRLAVGLEPEQMAEQADHGVAADARILEHEGVARIVLDGLDPHHQAMIVHARRAVLELAHALVDQRQQVLQQIGHRRIDRVASALGVALLEAEPVAQPTCIAGRCSSRSGSARTGSRPLRRRPDGRHR